MKRVSRTTNVNKYKKDGNAAPKYDKSTRVENENTVEGKFHNFQLPHLDSPTAAYLKINPGLFKTQPSKKSFHEPVLGN